MNISAYLGVAGLLDVGYRFYTTTETAVAARVTTGIVDAGDGWYSAEVTLPATAESVRWDSTGTAEAKAREYWPDPWGLLIPNGYPAGTAGKILGDNINATISSRATPVQVQTELTTYGALKPSVAGRTLDVNATGECGIDLDNTVGTLAKGTDITGFNDISTANVQTELVTYGALKPTVAARTLDVNATGEAGIDWANIGAPATTQNLSATTIATVGTLTNAPPDSSGVTTILARIPAALFGGITSLAQWLGMIAGKQTGNTTARTELRATGAGSGAYDETTDSQEAIRDRGDAAWTTGGGAGSDPWLTALPGAYSAGTAGNIIGNNLNATVSSRATQSSVDAIGTNVTGIKSKTDNLPVDPADASDLAASFTTVNGKLDTVNAAIDTEIPAIKAKTDLIPANPASVSDVPTAIQNADALLKRDMSAVIGEASRSPLNAMRLLRNKWSAVETPNTLTVKKEDDSTTAWTAPLTTDSAAAPITGMDPT